MSPLTVKGDQLLDNQNKPVILRGCNLGNWFVIEHWMWDQVNQGGPHDQYELEALLTKRFGEKEKDRLMEVHRSSWITDRDFEIIKSFRFNCIRLPLNYRLFEDDSKPYTLRKDAWKWTDKAIAMAEKHGIYVILDMHAVQGSQNDYDHSGRSGQNKLWSVPENSKRLAWLWGEIAKRYKDRAAVAAYDVFNEPYGGQFDEIKRVFQEVYPVIRKQDPKKLIWAHGRYDGFEFYGSPNENGWHNVGIQMHYYPGLFGNGSPTVRTHARHLESLEREILPSVKKFNSNFLIGEMNVVFNGAGGAEMMRRTYDLHEKHGWHTTMWSYKALNRTGGVIDAMWGMVANKNPQTELNFSTAPKSEIEGYFASHAKMPYAIHEDLRKAMSPVKSAVKPLPEFKKREVAPQEPFEDWTRQSIGGSLKGGLKRNGESFSLYGGGSDIWGVKDQFEFLSKTITGDFEISVQIEGLEDLGSYCKAGLMIRDTFDDNSPHAMVSVFPNAEVQFPTRTSKGGDTTAGATVTGNFPIWLKLQRKGTNISAFTRKNESETWQSVGTVEAKWMGERVFTGVVALSHDNGDLVEARYSNLQVRQSKE